MLRDPVCGMQVDDKQAPATSSYQGQQYVFCGPACKEKFDQNPSHYAQPKNVSSQASRKESQKTASR